MLVGAAWTAPVVLVATSAPAAAASPPVAGLIALTGVGANLIDGFVNVDAQVAYVGDGEPSPNYPVTAVTASVVIPTARLSGTPAPTISGTSWSYTGSSVEGSNTVLNFSYSATLTAATSPTPQLAFRVARTGDYTNFDVTVRANGTSNLLPVPQVQQTVTTAVGAVLIFNHTPPIQAQTGFQGPTPAYVFYGTAQWAGPYFPVGLPVNNIRAIARVLEANSTGDLILGSVAPEWTLVRGPEIVNGYWRVEYSYSGTLQQSNPNSPQLQIGLASTSQPPTLNVAEIRLEGTTSAGSTVFAQFNGPTVVTNDDPPVP